MKNAKTFLAALFLLGNIVASGTALAADGVVSKNELTAGSYCHTKFPAIDGRSLDSNTPVLKSRSSGDIIDFYGPCDENPTGQDQVQAQQLDREHQWDKESD
jgi:hypothetical protein